MRSTIASLNDGDLNGYNIDGLIGGNSAETTKSDFEISWDRLTTLQTREKRLEEDLKETKEKIQKLQHEIQNSI